MFNNNTIEDKINKNENQIKKLSVQLENLTREENELLEELKVTPEQLSQFVKNKENFTEKNWNELNQQREELDAKMLREIGNIRNPKKASEALKELRIDNSWLYVK